MVREIEDEGVTVATHPLVQHKLTQMRRRETSTAEFRRLARELSLLLAYEVTRDLPLKDIDIETPVAATRASVLAGMEPCLVSILRAGNGMLGALLDLVPQARVGHIGLYRDKATLKPVQYYLKLPDDLESRPAIVCDPMLATGNTAVAAITRLKERGAADIRFVCLLAAPEGLAVLRRAHPDVPVVTASVDEKLNDKSYIVPGLGDAGDRLYGTL